MRLKACKTRCVVAVGFVGVAVLPAWAQFSANNVTLRDAVTLATFGATSGSSCWGYVSPSGREYALMGLNNKMAVVEITDPDNALIVGSVSHADSIWCEVKTYGTYAYVSNETGGGIDVINLANVDSGVVTLVQRMTTAGIQTAHTVTVDEVSGFLYTNGANINDGRLVAWSLSNPANPSLAGQMSTAQGGVYVHDSQVVTYTSGPYAGMQVAFCANGTSGLDIVDVTNKSAMTLLSHRTYPNLGYCHQCWLTEDRQYLLINDELDGINRTTVFDVSNLANPVLVHEFSTGLGAVDHNQYVRDGFDYEADYTTGLQIFDVADPLNPVRTGFFDTYPENDGATYNGAWNVYPFFPSSIAIVSDIDRGLFVLDVSNAVQYLTFTYPDGRPETISPAGGTRLRVQVVGRNTTPQPGTGMLHYDAGSGFAAIPMEPVGGDAYDAVFPAVPCGTQVRYYVSVESDSGQTFIDPLAAPTTTYTVLSAFGTINVLGDDLETDTGWIAGAAGDNATTGVWVRVDPNGTPAQPEDDHTPAPGVRCWVTGQGSVGGSVGENDVDGGRTTLRSPRLDLSGLSHPRISYWRWYNNSAGASPNEDTFVVDISSDDGASWVNVEIVGPSGPQTAGGWFRHEFRVADFVPPTSQVRLRFVASDLGSGSIVEAAMDDLLVSDPDCEACPADLNGDGVVGLEDLSTLLAHYGAGGAQPEDGDLDRDGDVDLADLAAMLAAYGSTCS